MENKEEMLKKLGLKTMFNITDAEMPELVEEYEIFMNHVAEMIEEEKYPKSDSYGISDLKNSKMTGGLSCDLGIDL